eukprot:scaffold47609_cov23-Tisochrysis_lutea.AAC.1
MRAVRVVDQCRMREQGVGELGIMAQALQKELLCCNAQASGDASVDVGLRMCAFRTKVAHSPSSFSAALRLLGSMPKMRIENRLGSMPEMRIETGSCAQKP